MPTSPSDVDIPQSTGVLFIPNSVEMVFRWRGPHARSHNFDKQRFYFDPIGSSDGSCEAEKQFRNIRSLLLSHVFHRLLWKSPEVDLVVIAGVVLIDLVCRLEFRGCQIVITEFPK